MLALVNIQDLHSEHMYLKTTFLHGDLEEQIYMEQPEGFNQDGTNRLVCKLKTKDHPRFPNNWYQNMVRSGGQLRQV